MGDTWVCLLRIRSCSLCNLHYTWDVLDGERHYWLLISNVTSWYSGTILIDKTYKLGVTTRCIHFICYLCRLFSPTYHSEVDRWTPKLNDESLWLWGCIQSFVCWATLSVTKWIIEKMLSKFELLSVLVFFLCVCIIYMTLMYVFLLWDASSVLSCL